MSTTIIIIILCACCCFCSVALALGGFFFKDDVCAKVSIPFLCGGGNDSSTSPDTASAATTGTAGGTGDWKDGYATYYYSYPPCCKKAPNYDKNAPTDECDDYSGCKYMGEFAGTDKKLTFDEVKKRNILAFFSDKEQRSAAKDQKWWETNVKGKKVEIKSPAGKTLIVDALDTCGNYDCKNEGPHGCCTQNAVKGGGTLLDLEYNTAQRFWGTKPHNGKIKWRWAS